MRDLLRRAKDLIREHWIRSASALSPLALFLWRRLSNFIENVGDEKAEQRFGELWRSWKTGGIARTPDWGVTMFHWLNDHLLSIGVFVPIVYIAVVLWRAERDRQFDTSFIGPSPQLIEAYRRSGSRRTSRRAGSGWIVAFFLLVLFGADKYFNRCPRRLSHSAMELMREPIDRCLEQNQRPAVGVEYNSNDESVNYAHDFESVFIHESMTHGDAINPTVGSVFSDKVVDGGLEIAGNPLSTFTKLSAWFTNSWTNSFSSPV